MTWPKFIPKYFKNLLSTYIIDNYHFIIYYLIIKLIQTTFNKENQENNSYYFIPTKIKIYSYAYFCNQIKILYFKKDIFQIFYVFNWEK